MIRNSSESSGRETRFERLTRLASHLMRAPIVLVQLVDNGRLNLVEGIGINPRTDSAETIELAHSFCDRVIASSTSLIVADAREDALLKDDPAVTKLGVVAYAGIPLIGDADAQLGVFCAIDTVPRHWTDVELSLLKDIAESARSEILLMHAKDAAEASSRAKDRFLAMLSHELRMPISPALMIAQGMSVDPALPAAVREDAAVIHRNIQQQVRLIDDLLDVTRIENGKLDIRLHLLDLTRLTREVVTHFLVDATANGIALECDADDLPTIVLGDENRLKQAVGNIVKNAIKFTPRDGSVRMFLDHAHHLARIRIVDTGIGIAAEILPDLFTVFSQGPAARVREFGGLGLGLTIAKGIIDEHGGTIDVKSDGERRGTTFTIELPLALDAPASVDLPVPPRDHRNGTKADHADGTAKSPRVSILLVDDHEDTLRAMSRLLGKMNHRVVTAVCVRDALEAAESDEFDLLISDVGLPDGSGLELMRQLRARKAIQGIALTGYGSVDDHRQTLEAGFSTHLTKPIDMNSLTRAIEILADERD